MKWISDNSNPTKDGEYFCEFIHDEYPDDKPVRDVIKFKKGEWRGCAPGVKVTRWIDELAIDIRDAAVLEETINVLKWMMDTHTVDDKSLQSDSFNRPANAITGLEYMLEREIKNQAAAHSPAGRGPDFDVLWDKCSEHIDDDSFSFSNVAGSSVITKRGFDKLKQLLTEKTKP